MSLLRDFEIDIARLELGSHQFSFKIDDSFFKLFEGSLLEKGKLDVLVNLDKKTALLSLTFGIHGVVQLICDRSLDAFDYSIDVEKDHILKYGDEPVEISDELEVIPFNTQSINVANYLYEFITVSIPMKKLHPRYNDESWDDQIIYRSAGEDEVENPEPDPRWSELKKLKNKRSN